MIRVEFNAREAKAALEKAKAKLSDLTPLHNELAEYMTASTRKRFTAGVDPDGIPWKAKSATTVEYYRSRGYGGMALTRALYKIGRLKNEIVSYADRQGAVIGSNLIYAGVMQDGAARGAFGSDRRGRPIPWGRIPARRWLGITAQDERNLVDIAEEHLAADLGAAD